MKNKGFTLIELLVIIIILGLLLLIAIPSVTTIINNSKKETYIDTIHEILKGAKHTINDNKMSLYDMTTSYYFPITAFSNENGNASSPYGKIDEAYVVITYDGNNQVYYYVGKDAQNFGVAKPVKSDMITKASISDKVSSVSTSIGIGNRDNIIVYNDDFSVKEEKTATDHVNN